MAGYTSNIINMIADNLRDRYHSGFPILKELIQNADDSKAKRFVFGDHPGFNDADHPLLRGPGLWFFNDGIFKPSDKRSLRSFGENAKAGESGSIGKFGLGMKSVFHLCEAFIYLALDDCNKPHSVTLNPWDKGEDGNIHDDWVEPTEDARQRLNGLASAHVNDAKTWFLLWIPLRQQRHLQKVDGTTTGAIIERFPGDDDQQDLAFLADPELPRRLAVLLPLLHRLEQIKFEPSHIDWPAFHLQVESQGRLELEPDGTVAQASGKVIENGQKSPIFQFAGKKRLDQQSLFGQLKNHKAWPKIYCRDQNGQEMRQPDKSKPEGAVLIGHEDKQAGGLSLQWAVFLPLEDDSHRFKCPIPNSSRRYRIVLHGQYSIDAGRRGIHEYCRISVADNLPLDDMDESALRRRWNQEVAHRVTLPLVLPALADYVREHKLKDAEIRELTQALKNAMPENGGKPFGEVFLPYLCSRQAWARILSEQGGAWQLLDDPQQRLLSLPAPPQNDPARPWRVLPGLKRLEGAQFRDHAAPSFQKHPSQWLEDDWLTVVQAGVAEAFASPPGLDYLAEFLHMERERAYLNTGKVQSALLKCLKTECSRSMDTLVENRIKVQRVIGALLPERCLKLGPVDSKAKNAISDSIWRTLWECDTQVFPVPAYLYDSATPVKPSREDVLQWLKALQIKMEGKSADSALQVVGDLLKMLDESERGLLIRSNRLLKIVSAHNPRSRKNSAVSYDELECAKARNNLFAMAGGLNESQGLTDCLATVLPEETILLLNSENRKTIFSNQALPAANDRKAILASLIDGPTVKILGSAETRLGLLKQANKSENDPQARLGLRYLLHGDATHYEDGLSPLWIRGHGQSPAWEKLWRQVTGIQGEGAWNVLDAHLADAVPRSEWDSLKLKEIAPEEVIEALNGKADKIEGSKFTSDERMEILLKIPAVDSKLWRDLPLHTFENGGVGKIGLNTYLSGVDLPKLLKEQVRIVAKADDANLSRQQEQWISIMDSKAAANVALNTPNPVEYWELLLCAAPQIAESHNLDATAEKYAKVKWLPLKNGQAIAPQDVIDCETLADDIQRLAARAEYCYAGVNDLAKDIREHKQFDKLRKVFFACEHSAVLENLGLLMNSVPDYSIGRVKPEVTQFKNAAKVLKNYPQLPGWALISKAIEIFGPDDCLSGMVPQMSQALEDERITDVLKWLADQTGKTDALEAHNLYLSVLAIDKSKARIVLPKLRLYTQTGNWKQANELCHDAASIDKDVLLDSQQARCLVGIIQGANTRNEDQGSEKWEAGFDLMVQATPENLQNYFNPWAGLIRTV